MPRHVFDRCGLAALTDLGSHEWRELFAHMESEQSRFLAEEARFRSAAYPWPRDPLHTWSRVWEYPYAFHHLRARFAGAGTANAHVVDLGSGVTFFPFALARLGFHVTCVDVDSVCERDLGRATAVVGHAPGRIDFRLTDGSALPFEDSSIDGLYCVSVLEHIPRCDQVIAEIHRVLKPDGLLVLTIDLDLRGDAAIGVESRRRLRTDLEERFSFLQPDMTVHPADMLHSMGGPFPLSQPPLYLRLPVMAVRELKRRLLGVDVRPLPPPRLAVEAYVMHKVDNS